MHLVSLRDQSVRVSGRAFHFARGESIHTENSHKWRVDRFSAMAQRAGWAPTPRPRPQPFARPGRGNGLDEDAARVDISICDRNHELHLYAVAPGDGGPHRAAHMHAPLPLLAM